MPYTLNTRYKTCDNCVVLWYKRIHVAIVKKLSKKSRPENSFVFGGKKSLPVEIQRYLSEG